MKKLSLFVLMLFFSVSLAHAQGEIYTGTLSGTVLDTRTAPAPAPGQYSEDDAYNFGRALDMGPFYVLIADGTNRVHPLYSYNSSFFGTDVAQPDPNAEYLAPYVNRHVRISGEISTGPNWPSIAKITNIENA
jgi:hypothetical protein